MAHFNFVISQNAKWGHAGFYIDCHQMTVPENIFFTKKALVAVFKHRLACVKTDGQTGGKTDSRLTVT